jgi:hypothetical protein
VDGRPARVANLDRELSEHLVVHLTNTVAALDGPIDYPMVWVLVTFLGAFGVHRFCLGKSGTGILYLVTLGLFGIGLIYDFWTLNSQISELNLSKQAR